jgi:hypothetical protein
MKIKFLNTAVAGLVLSISCLVNFANAGVILSDSTAVNTSGQDYSRTFDVTGFEDYKNLVFTVNARGDYGLDEYNEFIKFLIDGTSFGNYRYDTIGVTSFTGPTGDDKFDIIIDFTFTVSDIDWNNFASDSQVSIQWDNSANVGSAPGFYVNYSLSGNPAPVPEPATLAIFALGMIGLASRRLNKKS